jgi:aspartyl-tRNA(Asn)/glutamyl-tRNA(Gln) amidotransferase subunit C
MKLSRQEVKHISRLARMRLEPEEETRYAEQLSAILEYASRLEQVDTSSIPPTASVLPLTAPLRPDEPRPALPAQDLFENAAQSQDGQFRVPPVLDNHEE